MKISRILATAAILSAAGTLPAFADWDRIGSVDVSFHQDHDRAYTSFGGGIERLQLRAEDSAVNCRSIRATFGNGDTRQIFSGRLPRNRAVTVDLPGRARDVQRLDFSCQAMRRSGATVNIFADVGRYREDWRRSPGWGRTWSRMFNWADDNVNAWVLLSTETFEGRRDSESSFGGWRGRSVDRIGLKPTNADARCMRVTATFRDGQTRDLNLDGGDLLHEDRMTQVDLPGDQRDLVRLNLRCHAEGARRVQIEIYARK